MQAIRGAVSDLLVEFDEKQRARQDNPDAFGQTIASLKVEAPRAPCPSCYGRSSEGNCYVCNGRGLVCPACRGARVVRDSRLRFCSGGGQHPMKGIVDCPICTPGGVYTPEGELAAINAYMSDACEPWRGFGYDTDPDKPLLVEASSGRWKYGPLGKELPIKSKFAACTMAEAEQRYVDMKARLNREDD